MKSNLPTFGRSHLHQVFIVISTLLGISASFWYICLSNLIHANLGQWVVHGLIGKALCCRAKSLKPIVRQTWVAEYVTLAGDALQWRKKTIYNFSSA